jgi:hypothetical protein
MGRQHKRCPPCSGQKKRPQWSTTFCVSGEKPLLPFVCRRTNRVQFTAQKIDLAAYYRQEVNPAAQGSRTLFHSYGLAPDLTYISDVAEKGVKKYLRYEARWSETVPDSERVFKGATRVPLTKTGVYLIEAQAADSTEAGRSRGLAAPYERRTHTSRVMLVLTDIAIVHVKC